MQTGWPGISSAFFASDTLPSGRIETLLRYIGGEPSSGYDDVQDDKKKPVPRTGRSFDPDMRSKVEKSAIAAVRSHYESRDWHVESVESLNQGWDLRATFGRRELFIEVKGRLAHGLVEITPNEYAAMLSDERRMGYRLAIVFDALSASPGIAIFEWAPGRNLWVTEDGKKVLRLEEKMGALAGY